MVYDYVGDSVGVINDIYEEMPEFAYDINKNIVYKKGLPFTIMTYNVGSWYGYGQSVPSQYASSYYEMHDTIFKKHKPDFVGIQEYNSVIGSYSAESLIRQTCPHFYGVDKISGCAGRAFASKYQISSISDNLFSHQDGGEPRYYLKGYMVVNGKRICIISAHTSYNGTYPYVQCNELLDVIESEEYFIVVGDMNWIVDEIGNTNYNLLTKVWEDKGYYSASGKQFGIKKTFYSQSQGWHGIDQIFTSPNRRIESVLVDDTKTNEYASLIGTSRIDHCALIANVLLQ